LTKGEFRYDFGDTVGLTPLLPMYTLGHDFMPPALHAGGLRYHGMSPIISRLYKDKLIEAQAYEQADIFESAVLFSRTEGIIPAPESAHAIKAAIVEALQAKKEGTKKVILFNLSGHGHFDMSAYDAFLSGHLDSNGKG
jgi:tryptophan synthase beta chain